MGLILAGYLSLLCAQYFPPMCDSSDDASLSLVRLQTKDVDTNYQVELEMVRGEATPQQTATTTVDGRSQESGLHESWSVSIRKYGECQPRLEYAGLFSTVAALGNPVFKRDDVCKG